MKTARIRINEGTLRKIVSEELSFFQNEAIDHEGIKTVVNSASKLLKTAEEFKEKSTPQMISSLSPHLDRMIQSLTDMVSNPSSYIKKPKPQQKRIKFRRVNNEATDPKDRLNPQRFQIGDEVYVDGRRGEIVHIHSLGDAADVDFGHGDVYGITFNRMSPA